LCVLVVMLMCLGFSGASPQERAVVARPPA